MSDIDKEWAKENWGAEISEHSLEFQDIEAGTLLFNKWLGDRKRVIHEVQITDTKVSIRYSTLHDEIVAWDESVWARASDAYQQVTAKKRWWQL